MNHHDRTFSGKRRLPSSRANRPKRDRDFGNSRPRTNTQSYLHIMRVRPNLSAASKSRRYRMIFQDQSHINRVRDALWQRSGNGTSIMVGSGFSRNAVPAGSQTALIPSWEEVANWLHNELYQDVSNINHHNQLRTAQEYKDAFGRRALHGTLHRLVRQDEYHPGKTHQRLLQLPWQDIFTTNWDTLLERTRNSVVERHYSVINSVAEIPMSKRPRIVKLHGSFPAQYPLIVIEEDYRTYPAKFAPFVNTVQQALMETVFLLIGFSGDDPNFLNWSGWVRDNLGPSAPKIYLAGYLELSQHRRRTLENRDIVPIDLAQHPNANRWPENTRHEYATQWLLHTLENGEPYRITEWPNPSSTRLHPVPEYLQPGDEMIATRPKEEPQPPDLRDSQNVDLAQAIKEVTAVWEHNRKMYPGWLVLPGYSRYTVSKNTDQWAEATIKSLDHLTPIERLRAIREILWRKSNLLEPIDENLANATNTTLAMFDCDNRTVDGKKAPGTDWKEIGKPGETPPPSWLPVRD